MSEALVAEWLAALGYGGANRALISDLRDVGRRPYAAELRDLLDPAGAYGLDAVYLIEDTPTVCFIRSERVPEDAVINQLRQRLWNQNLASALIVLHATELRAYSVPKWRKSDTFQSLAMQDARPDGYWSAAEFESSTVQRRLSDWFDPSRRVDRDLLRQLSAAVTQMTSGDNPPIRSQLQAQMVMAQVLFISYLEHRSIIGDDYREEHDLGKFHELICKANVKGIDKLLAQLRDDLNGDFLKRRNITWQRLNPRALTIVDRFLSRVDLETGQLDFWNYDFSQIPVELLSGIYETFLQDKNKIDGAYYTPRVLAELAVEQAFDGFDDLSSVTVYDGACGSGILLTTAFRKIVAYREDVLGRTLDINERIELLQRTIFGSDINRIACRVTAFSLYLCILERLTPSDLVRLQRDIDCKLPPLVGPNIVEGHSAGDFFSDSNPFSGANRFDVVISNPPWRELKEREGVSAKRWSARHKVAMPHKQIAAAFAARASCAARQGGRIVLLLPSSLITAPTNADFLRQFSIRVSIDRIINLADFRRLLFSKAEHACTVLRATNQDPLLAGRLEGRFQYWMPKVDISFAFNRLTLHDYDAIDLPQISLIRDNSTLRRRSWGGSRDDALVQRLAQFQSLRTTAKQRKWVVAKGYHMTDGDKKANTDPLKGLKFLDTKVLNSPSPVVDTSLLQPLPLERGVASLGDLRMYDGPRILWPDGTSVEIEVRAAYADTPFCFNSAVGGLVLARGEQDIAKFIACYLRSNLAKYWLILNGYSASAERARVSLAEIMSLPFIEPQFHHNSTVAREAIAAAADKITHFQSLVGTAFAEAEYELARDGIDEVIFNYFDLSSQERVLVMDMVDLAAKSLQPTSYDELFTPLQDEVAKQDIKRYIAQLQEVLETWSRSRGGNGHVVAQCLDRSGSRTPLDIVHISLHKEKTTLRKAVALTAADLIQLIQSRVSDGHPLNFFAMPNSTFIIGNDIYIVKPARMRFWSRSAAMRDADDIVAAVAMGHESTVH